MMKKICILLFVALVVFGVQQGKAQIDFGVVAGMNVSKANIKDYRENFRSSNRAGWFVGPKVEFTVPVVGIGADISAQYSQRSINVNDNPGERNKKLNSIEIPVNLRYQFGVPSLVAAYVATGPQFGFNIGNGTIKDIRGVDYKINNSVLTWNVGAGVKVMKHLEVGVGYNIALSKFAKYTGTKECNLKANTFQAHVGYFF